MTYYLTLLSYEATGQDSWSKTDAGLSHDNGNMSIVCADFIHMRIHTICRKQIQSQFLFKCILDYRRFSP